ncbi:hypothetical protein ACO0QE_002960 [Hanseniaspora vineae]
MAKPNKNRFSIIKLVSTALTGYSRTMVVKKTKPLVTQIKYDPIAKRHVLFEEHNKRKAKPKQPLKFLRY